MKFSAIYKLLVLQVVLTSSLFSAGKIIVVNGGVFSGGHFLARIIKDKLSERGENWVHFSKDDCYKEGYRLIEQGQHVEGGNMVATYLNRIVAIVDSHVNVVIDWAFTSDKVFCQFLYKFLRYNVFFIKVDCTEQQARKNLELYKTVAQKRLSMFTYQDFCELITLHYSEESAVHADKLYDFVLDANYGTSYSKDELADRVASAVYAFDIFVFDDSRAFIQNLLSSSFSEDVMQKFIGRVSED